LNNTDYGTWFSLSQPANCADSDPIGTNGCAWKLNQRLKTISIKCALSMGLQKACLQDGGIPFMNATQVLVQALMDCEALNPPSDGDSDRTTGRVQVAASPSSDVTDAFQVAMDLYEWKL
jgi:hypothetical protein